MEYESFCNKPPDKIVDKNNKILVGPVLIFYERGTEGKFICTKLSSYLSKDRLKEYGLDKGNPVFHLSLDIYRKKSKISSTEQLRLTDVYIEYIPNCILSTVFEDKQMLCYRTIRSCKIAYSFTGNPVVIDDKQEDTPLPAGDHIKFGVTLKDNPFKSILIEPNDINKWLKQFI